MNLQSSDFELFELEPRFAQDRLVIDAHWKDLQRQAHPDRFAAQGSSAQRVALQWSVRINEAYQRLKDPLRRAAYLCELHGASIDAHSNTAMPAEFLQQQLAWREALDDAGDRASLQRVGAEVDASQWQLMLACEQSLDVVHDYAAAAGQVRALMFFQRFMLELQARADAMETGRQASAQTDARGQ